MGMALKRQTKERKEKERKWYKHMLITAFPTIKKSTVNMGAHTMKRASSHSIIVINDLKIRLCSVGVCLKNAFAFGN